MTLVAERRARIAELWEAGEDPASIAAELGITEAQVDRVIDRVDVPTVFPEQERQESSGRGHVRSKAVAGGDQDFADRLQGQGPRDRTAPQIKPPKRVPKPKSAPKLKADPKPPRQLVPCGTPGAYARHLKNGEKACEPCQTAARERAEARRRARGVGPRQAPKHGTRSGYVRHYERGEKPCDECRDFYNADRRKRHAQRAGRDV